MNDNLPLIGEPEEPDFYLTWTDIGISVVIIVVGAAGVLLLAAF